MAGAAPAGRRLTAAAARGCLIRVPPPHRPLPPPRRRAGGRGGGDNRPTGGAGPPLPAAPLAEAGGLRRARHGAARCGVTCAAGACAGGEPGGLRRGLREGGMAAGLLSGPLPAYRGAHRHTQPQPASLRRAHRSPSPGTVAREWRGGGELCGGPPCPAAACEREGRDGLRFGVLRQKKVGAGGSLPECR